MKMFEDVYNRPPLLEEPFAQTLSGIDDSKKKNETRTNTTEKPTLKSAGVLYFGGGLTYSFGELAYFIHRVYSNCTLTLDSLRQWQQGDEQAGWSEDETTGSKAQRGLYDKH